MKRVNYEMLLRIRQRQEDARAMALAAVRRAAQVAEEQRQRISETQRQTLESAREVARERLDASELRLYYQYERHLARLGVEADARIHELEQQIEARRDDLVEATKRKKVVERLKESQDELILKEFRRLEQIASNEVAVNYAALRRAKRGKQNQE
ncbi:MAG: flagellar FliJ family protein [Candidatus Hydrogenedentes bacterium]|nr:flagellar FliJ family protein [Candidatus Hydrogenedentota bacterium]